MATLLKDMEDTSAQFEEYRQKLPKAKKQYSEAKSSFDEVRKSREPKYRNKKKMAQAEKKFRRAARKYRKLKVRGFIRLCQPVGRKSVRRLSRRYAHVFGVKAFRQGLHRMRKLPQNYLQIGVTAA
ncbi:MAG: hypothetical protein ACLTSK_00885 [Christensenellales bacterium]